MAELMDIAPESLDDLVVELDPIDLVALLDELEDAYAEESVIESIAVNLSMQPVELREIMLDLLHEEDRRRIYALLTEGFQVELKGIENGTLYVVIQGKEYGYQPKAGMSVEQLQAKFKELLKYNRGRAISVLKDLAHQVYGGLIKNLSFPESLLTEDATLIKDDKSTDHVDSVASATARERYQNNKETYRKAFDNWRRSARAKNFYSRLGRFNSRRSMRPSLTDVMDDYVHGEGLRMSDSMAENRSNVFSDSDIKQLQSAGWKITLGKTGAIKTIDGKQISVSFSGQQLVAPGYGFFKDVDALLKRVKNQWESKKQEDTLPDGLGDRLTIADVDPEQFRMGMEVEKEHTPDELLRTDIVLDHLAENPQYYTTLQQIENESVEVDGMLKDVREGKDPDIIVDNNPDEIRDIQSNKQPPDSQEAAPTVDDLIESVRSGRSTDTILRQLLRV